MPGTKKMADKNKSESGRIRFGIFFQGNGIPLAVRQIYHFCFYHQTKIAEKWDHNMLSNR
ncbi:hypothetical protein SAMN05444412_11626 [Rhodonellum ikkaensis]|uniref:Uncharacterized protein n=1 Tax=Rhodonellum ikkaensis TaxID=336829 RepID=A0A1H3TA56_9BACT|nr:hypothetical protein SAMN05444412_11626 [Rhodonellum ikkaensis]